jgi:hypothetical protein
MNDLDRSVAQALLNYQREVQQLGHGLPAESYCTAYADACELAGLPRSYARCLRWPLLRIARWCDTNGWPHLNALVVNAIRRRPGGGFEGAGQCTLESWENDVLSCINFHGYPEVVPAGI